MGMVKEAFRYWVEGLSYSSEYQRSRFRIKHTECKMSVGCSSGDIKWVLKWRHQVGAYILLIRVSGLILAFPADNISNQNVKLLIC